jgi:hypothetical protein
MERPAVKISVSLPESLKEELDRYAVAHDLSLSATVQQALEAFLHPATDPGPGPSPLEPRVAQLEAELARLQRQLERTHEVLAQHREFLVSLQPLQDLAGIALTLPPYPSY